MTLERGLESERDFLLASLGELEAERAAGDLDEADYQTLHDHYTARAAVVLRAVAAGSVGGSAPATSTRTPRRIGRPRPVRTRRSGATKTLDATSAGLATGDSPAPRSPGGRRSMAITLAVVLAVVAVAIGTVVTFAGQRRGVAPVSGSIPQGSAGTVGEALALERDGEVVEALKLYDQALRADPGNVEVLAYRGWLLKRAGMSDEALASLDRAVAVDPTYPDAHFFRGMVLFQDRQDPAGAVVEFRKFLANDPPAPMVPMVQGVLERALKEAVATDPPPPTAPAG